MVLMNLYGSTLEGSNASKTECKNPPPKFCGNVHKKTHVADGTLCTMLFGYPHRETARK